MGGNAILEDNLIDDLVGDVIDDLRAELYDSMGTRQYEVHIVRRTWTGPKRREGVVVAVQDITMSPPPLFTDLTKYKLTPGGRTDQGDGRLSEVSLTYSEMDLLGGKIAPNEEFYYRVIDLRGQGIAPSFYVPNGRATSDRENTIGWVVSLNRAEIKE